MDNFSECNVCGGSVRYGERHHACGEFITTAENNLKERISSLILNDSWACTFQTIGQYRSALLKEINMTANEQN